MLHLLECGIMNALEKTYNRKKDDIVDVYLKVKVIEKYIYYLNLGHHLLVKENLS